MFTYVYVYQWVFNVIPDQAGSHVLDIIYSYWVFAGLAPLQVKLTFHSLNCRLSQLFNTSRPASWVCLPASAASTAAGCWTSPSWSSPSSPSPTSGASSCRTWGLRSPRTDAIRKFELATFGNSCDICCFWIGGGGL